MAYDANSIETKKIKDETGNRYGKWTIIKYIPPKERGEKDKKLAWLAQCDCGTIRPIKISDLRNGKSKSCGCTRRLNRQIILNKRYGKITPIERLTNRHGNFIEQYKCICECGNEIILPSDLIGKKKNCGCSFGEGFSKYTNCIGKRFGKLVVIGDSDRRDKEGKRTHRICQCDCGNICEVSYKHLSSGHTQSCGCIESFGEECVKQILDENQISYVRQYKNEECKDKIPLPFDFAIFIKNKIAFIEVQGKQHYDSTLLFWSENLAKHDKIKKDFCNQKKYPLLILDYSKGKQKNTKTIFEEKILSFIKEVENE